MSLHFFTIDAKGNLATLGAFNDRREAMKLFYKSSAVAGVFTTDTGTLLSTVQNPKPVQLKSLTEFARAVLSGALVPPPAEVCPSPTLPAPPPPAPREPAPVRQLPVRPRPAPPPPAPPPAAAKAPSPLARAAMEGVDRLRAEARAERLAAKPSPPVNDLDKALDALARVREDLERTAAQLGDVSRERDALRTRVTELETLSRRAAELEAIAVEASRAADAAGARAQRLALELAAVNATAQSALAALARETARADGLAADLARRDNSPRVLAAVAARRVRVAAPRAQHPMAAIADHLRRRAGR